MEDIKMILVLLACVPFWVWYVKNYRKNVPW